MDSVGGIDTGAEFTLRYAPDPERWSGDFNFWVGAESTDAFVTAGIHDIGEGDRANAQFGWRFSDAVSGRVGVHRGKLGLGLDWRSDAVRFISDAYDLNDLRWDIYAGFAVLPELDIIVGVEDFLKEEELNFALAFRF